MYTKTETLKTWKPWRLMFNSICFLCVLLHNVHKGPKRVHIPKKLEFQVAMSCLIWYGFLKLNPGLCKNSQSSYPLSLLSSPPGISSIQMLLFCFLPWLASYCTLELSPEILSPYSLVYPGLCWFSCSSGGGPPFPGKKIPHQYCLKDHLFDPKQSAET